MSNDNNTSTTIDLIQSESLSLKRDLYRYLKYWKWILIGAILALIVSFLYLKYTARIYQTTAKIKILKKKESGLDLSGLTKAAPLFDMSSINLENEIQILESRRIVGQVVDILNLNVYYFKSGTIKSQELFGSEIPFVVDWLFDDDILNSQLKKDTFLYSEEGEDSFRLNIVDKSFDKVFKYGEEINIDGFNFIIYKNQIYDTLRNQNSRVYFTYKQRKAAIGSLLKKIKTEPVGDDSGILELKLSGTNVLKSESILNNLINLFNQDGIEDDRQIALKTVDFVSKRLSVLESELDTVETDLVQFKSSNNFIGEGIGTSSLIDTYKETEGNRAELQNQLEIAKYLQDETKSNSQFSLLPGNVGLESPSTNTLISDYNSLVLERKRILTSSTETSPQVVALSQRLRLLNSNIKVAIKNYISSIQISLQNMRVRERQFNSSIRAIPEKEKIAREIIREQSVKENLYIFLLQKQVEADLSAAITAPTAKIVDYAFTPTVPVSPKTSVVYLAGLVIGLAFPIGVLYIMYLFDTKITSKEQVQAKLNVPIIAEIPINKEYDGKIVKSTDNSNVAESFRILKTNLNYLVQDNLTEDTTKVIFSTSSIKGEGKTFCAINLASVFSSNNIKTLLIGADLRNPQLHNYLGVSKKNIGLSSYLTNQELNIEDVIFKNEKNLKFDIILSGEIPPNPSELLNNGRLETLIDEAKGIYDKIIIDTAPTLLVTDTLSIFNYADLVIYMIRANFTELKILRHVRDLVNFNMQKKIGIGINGIDEKKGYEYNYGYGYGYDASTKVKKWYNF